MRLGGEVDDGIDISGNLPDEIDVGDVALNEAESRVVTHLVQICQIPGIGQEIETKHLIVGPLVEHVPHVGGTDKTGGAGNQNAHSYSPPPTLARSRSV
jgi:hypothetical protein